MVQSEEREIVTLNNEMIIRPENLKLNIMQMGMGIMYTLFLPFWLANDIKNCRIEKNK